LLWIKYRRESGEEIKEYLQTLKTTEQERYRALAKDMQDLSEQVGFHIYGE
jgi:hypothetical protein